MKNPLNDRKFITRRNFWNEQTLLAEAIYNDAVLTQRSTAEYQRKPNTEIVSLTTSVALQITAAKHDS